MRNTAVRTKRDAKFQMIGAMPGEQMAALTLGEPVLTDPQSMCSAAPACSVLAAV